MLERHCPESQDPRRNSFLTYYIWSGVFCVVFSPQLSCLVQSWAQWCFSNVKSRPSMSLLFKCSTSLTGVRLVNRREHEEITFYLFSF